MVLTALDGQFMSFTNGFFSAGSEIVKVWHSNSKLKSKMKDENESVESDLAEYCLSFIYCNKSETIAS